MATVDTTTSTQTETKPSKPLHPALMRFMPRSRPVTEMAGEPAV